ncbi:hypothetical protein PROVRETT_07076 [Providencia rettgeri DSM 1131]|nr:hypothetical protein PROVRETT_07076 [Providencia rettgeri DSM 1131]
MNRLTDLIMCYVFYHDLFFAWVKTKKPLSNKLGSVHIRTEALALVGYGLQTKMHYNKIVIMITFLGISYSEITVFWLTKGSM